jgi:hypothetical protein
MYAKVDHLDHSEFIKQLVYLTGCESYLELGIYDGNTFNKIVPFVKKAVAVDIKDFRVNKSLGVFHQCTTDTFFNEINTGNKFDIIFIDADHKFISVMKDFNFALNHLNKHGIIILHDTDPSSQELLQDGYCSDCYKVVNQIKKYYDYVDIVTLPISECGLSLVKLKNDVRVNEFLKENV